MKKTNCKDNVISDDIKRMIQQYKEDKSNLIQILNFIQEHNGYIAKEVIEYLSEEMSISAAEIYGVVTFYSRFSLEPKGKYSVSVCMGTACYVKGAEKILEKIRKELEIDLGETTKDGKFSLDQTRCLGACGLAPVFTINGEVYGKATEEIVEKVLQEYRNK